MFAAYMPQMNSLAESRMLDTFDICTQGDGHTFNQATGNDERTLTVLFRTKGRVKVASAVGSARETEAGDRTAVELHRELHIPTDSPAVPAGSIAVAVDLHATTDPTLAGANLRITGPAPGSQTTARRMAVTEVTS